MANRKKWIVVDLINKIMLLTTISVLIAFLCLYLLNVKCFVSFSNLLTTNYFHSRVTIMGGPPWGPCYTSKLNKFWFNQSNSCNKMNETSFGKITFDQKSSTDGQTYVRVRRSLESFAHNCVQRKINCV